jgi:hypothetical protein
MRCEAAKGKRESRERGSIFGYEGFGNAELAGQEKKPQLT